jgi:hypothetical protein
MEEDGTSGTRQALTTCHSFLPIICTSFLTFRQHDDYCSKEVGALHIFNPSQISVINTRILAQQPSSSSPVIKTSTKALITHCIIESKEIIPFIIYKESPPPPTPPFLSSQHGTFSIQSPALAVQKYSI